MKRLVLASAVALAFSGAAYAESSVTLYGAADVGATVTKLKDQSATVSMSNGNWLSNKFGIKGNEDLGNGYSVFFTLEQGYQLSSGNESISGKAFGRQSFVGVKGGFGQIAVGRIGALGSDNGDYTIMGWAPYTTSFQAIGSVYSAFIVTDWMDNTIVYQTPEFSGLTGYLMYSNGVDEDTNKWSHNQHYYGVGLTYEKEALNVQFYWEMLDHKGEQDVDKPKSTNLFTLGASYDFGVVTLYGGYQYALHTMELPNYTAISSLDTITPHKGANQHAFSLGLSGDLAGGTWMLQSQAAFGKLKDTDKSYNSWSVGAAYLYPLSKRTTLYADAAYGSTGKAFKQYNAESGLSGWTATIGMAHSF